MRNTIIQLIAAFIPNRETRHAFRRRYKRRTKFRKLRDDNIVINSSLEKINIRLDKLVKEINTIKSEVTDIKQDKDWLLAQKNYNNILQKIRKKFGTSKIKVCFLVGRRQLWGYQSLYDRLLDSQFFEPIVLIYKFTKCDPDEMKKYHKFFSQKNIHALYAYNEENQLPIPLHNFDVDIVFYQEPELLNIIHKPLAVSNIALTFYVPYSFGVHQSIEYYKNHNRIFRYLYAYFASNQYNAETVIALNNYKSPRCKVIGYPKLDAYFEAIRKKINSNGKKIVIYAPHHSCDKNTLLSFGTFQFNGKSILKMAQKYADHIYWIFKPHPFFFVRVVECNILSQVELEEYCNEWGKIGIMYAEGDYIDYFRQSDALITDCASFLAEYLPSEKPVFHLINQYHKPFTPLIETISNTYYRIENDYSQLESIFKRVVIDNDDYKKEKRLSNIPLVFDKKERASDKILRYLINLLKNEYEI